MYQSWSGNFKIHETGDIYTIIFKKMHNGSVAPFFGKWIESNYKDILIPVTFKEECQIYLISQWMFDDFIGWLKEMDISYAYEIIRT